MGFFDKAPKIKSEEEETFVNELQKELTDFYDSLKQECESKKEGEAFLRKVKSDLDKKMSQYLSDISDVFSNKHNDPADSEFRQNQLNLIKDDFHIHLDTEKQGIEFID